MGHVLVVHSSEPLVLGIGSLLRDAGYDVATIHGGLVDAGVGVTYGLPRETLLYEYRKPFPTSAPHSVAGFACSVAMLDGMSDSRLVRDALNDGADAVVDERSSGLRLKEVLDAALSGFALVTAQMLRHLANAAGALPGDCGLTAAELKYLRGLADGGSVLDLASSSGRSERDMYRVLAGIWKRLGVKGRTEGLVVAAEAGWLHGEPSTVGGDANG